ncbi:glycosyltransferase [Saccharospirillum sp. HFRX-1]|uniref:hypothetical protein n=1 Tax=unclassified Saccharospirillum TaxID=2633430 RepID=UPI003712C26D
MDKKTIMVHPLISGNPYIRILYDSMGEYDYEGFYSSRLGFLFNGARVLHIHWMDDFISGGVVKGFLRMIRLLVVALVIRLRGGLVIWTLHNSVSYTHNRRHRVYARWLGYLLQVFVNYIIVHSDYQREHIKKRFRKKAVTVLHHNYLSDIALHLNPDIQNDDDNSVLYFGMISEYKGVDRLVDAYNKSQRRRKLEVCGFCEPSYGECLIQSDSSRSISFDFGWFSDEQLYQKIIGAGVIVLPHVSITNSGSLYLALSLRKTVIIRRSQLVEETLQKWPDLAQAIYTFDHDDQLRQLLDAVEVIQDASCFDSFIQDTSIDKVRQSYLELYAQGTG